MSPRALSRLTLGLFAAATLACSGDMLRSCTSAVVGETVEATKEVTKGVADGIDDGRKQGASVDGATLVSTWDELDGKGAMSVHEVTADGAGCVAVLAVSNTTEAPLRLMHLEVTGLDSDGFVLKPAEQPRSQITVPGAAKDKLMIRFEVPPEKLGQLRVWGRDLPVR
ncbi:MAG: hypothetical protein JNM72_02045 [Deltaproteobacteria bacterium]|jgi:hypothetical protein|nr:hypothetical protein [Deltaproteobacteria bacterium]